MKVHSRICLFIGGVSLALILAGFWASHQLKDRLPNPNGYDDFLKAAHALEGDLVAYQDLGLERAKSFAETNHPVLAHVRRGLQKDTLVPLKPSAMWFASHREELRRFKRVVHTLITLGKVAQSQGQNEEALNIHLDALRFSYHVVRGGLAFDYQHGISFKALVFQSLGKMVSDLNPEQARQVERLLQELEEEQEPLEAIIRRERAWLRKTYGQTVFDQGENMVNHRSVYPEVSNLLPTTQSFEQQRNDLLQRLNR